MFIRLLLLFTIVSLGATSTAQRAASNDTGYQTTTSVTLAVLPVPSEENDSDADLAQQSAAAKQPLKHHVLAQPLCQQWPSTDYLIPQPRAPPRHT